MKRASSYQERKSGGYTEEDENAVKVGMPKVTRPSDCGLSDSGSGSTSFDIESENGLRANVLGLSSMSDTNRESNNARINSIKIRSNQMIASFHEA